MTIELLASLRPLRTVTNAVATLAVLAACGGSAPPTSEPKAVALPDARAGLKGGPNAAEAVSNLKVLARAASPQGFTETWNSDIAFREHYAIQGNFQGFLIWDIANPAQPKLVTSYTGPASQHDVSV